jgi:hypothetical protein
VLRGTCTTKVVTSVVGGLNGISSFCNAVTGKRDEVHDGPATKTVGSRRLREASYTATSPTLSRVVGGAKYHRDQTGAGLVRILPQ